MDLLQNTDYFTPYKDPESDVTIYILSKKVAPLQKVIYYVTDSMTADGRYLWFYCAFPPASATMLGRLDFQTGEMDVFPETECKGGPYFDLQTGDAYWGMRNSIWKRGPQAGDKPELVGSIPTDLIGSRTMGRMATHMTVSADGREFFLDAQIGLQYVFGTMEIATGKYEFWHRFDRNHNHAQFSPTDPDLVEFSQENHPDQLTGITTRITDRMWLMRRGEKPYPIFKEPTVTTHEWWDKDGEHVWYIQKGSTKRVNIKTLEVEDLRWPEGSWHSYNHNSNKYVVGDSNVTFYRGTPSKVQFLNRETGKSVHIISHPAMPGLVGENYHIDPHPRFVGNDQYVVFTTVARGEVDIAIVPTADLIEASL